MLRRFSRLLDRGKARKAHDELLAYARSLGMEVDHLSEVQHFDNLYRLVQVIELKALHHPNDVDTKGVVEPKK